MTINLNDFIEETECVYKNEHYSVRDNGSVLRHAREGKRMRKDDNQWTFGISDPQKYLRIGTEVIHRIIATAFHGEPPSSQHVVDHIDTNHQNNRPENLRWLTKLENILNNPSTVKKIKYRCGSVEAFIEDPSVLRNQTNKDPNIWWMRPVTPKEAQIFKERMSDWPKKENDGTKSKGVLLGEWIFRDNNIHYSSQGLSEITTSETPNAVQKNWRTPSEFPICPKECNINPIDSYARNLKIGGVFSCNKYSKSIISDYETSVDGKTLWVMCKSDQDKSIKPWSLAQVTHEGNLYVHTNLGSFFDKIGVGKQLTLEQGLEWTGGKSIDDLT